MEGKLAGRGDFASRITVRCRGVDEYESQSAAQGARGQEKHFLKSRSNLLGRPELSERHLSFPLRGPPCASVPSVVNPRQPRSRFASAMTARA
jgi:hypothetical protein